VPAEARGNIKQQKSTFANAIHTRHSIFGYFLERVSIAAVVEEKQLPAVVCMPIGRRPEKEHVCRQEITQQNGKLVQCAKEPIVAHLRSSNWANSPCQVLGTLRNCLPKRTRSVSAWHCPSHIR
jgi:hypothetical protein